MGTRLEAGSQSSREAKAFLAAAKRTAKETPALSLLGFELVAVARGRAVVRMNAGPRHRQVHGVVHGGIIAALADTASGIAAYTTVPHGTAIATVELKINFLEAVPGGKVRAEARVLRTGRNFVVVECEVFDQKERLAAKALLTFGAASGHALHK